MSTPQEIINNCFYEQTIEIIKTIYQDIDKEELNIDDLIDQMKNHWKIVSGKSSKKVVTEKKKRVTKEFAEDVRCIALKKDGEQCKGGRTPKGQDPTLCSLHNNKAPKFGTINSPQTSEIVKKICSNMLCQNTVDKGKINCNIHKEKVTLNKTITKIKKDMKKQKDKILDPEYDTGINDISDIEETIEEATKEESEYDEEFE